MQRIKNLIHEKNASRETINKKCTTIQFHLSNLVYFLTGNINVKASLGNFLGCGLHFSVCTKKRPKQSAFLV